MPSGPVHQDNTVGLARHVSADLIEVHLHGLGIGERHHQRSPLALCRTDRSEEIGVLVTLVGWEPRACPCLWPKPGTPILLAQPCLVLKPELDRRAFGQMAYMRGEDAIEVSPIKSRTSF